MKKQEKNALLGLSIFFLLVAGVTIGFAWGWQKMFNFFLYNKQAYLIYAVLALFGLFALFLYIKPKRD